MELTVDGLNISTLSDDELADRLRSLGFPVGPIVDTTRRVYQLKLAKLLKNEDPAVSDSEETEQETRSLSSVASSHLQPEAVVSPSGSFYNASCASFDRSPSLPFRYEELRRRPLPRGEINWSLSSSTAESVISAEGLRSKVSVPPSKAGSKGALSTGVKIAIVACVLLFIVLVYHNMESSTTNPVPEFSVP